jgi:hypothetical protein
MKFTPLTPTCAVQSITYTPERRVITLSRIAPPCDYVQQPVKHRKPPFRLHLKMAPEAASSFEPVVQVRSQSKS